MVSETILAALIAAVTALAPTDANADIVERQSLYRPLVVFAPAQDARLDTLRQHLEDNRAALADRDMIVAIVSDGTVEIWTPASGMAGEPAMDAAAMTARYASGTPFELVLVGKDTGIKDRATSPDELDDMFDLIDTMPMRQREMGRR